MSNETETRLPSALRGFLALIGAAWLALALAAPTAASAAFDVVSFSNDAVDAGGDPYLAAGGHPYAVVNDFELPVETSSGLPLPDGQLKDLTATLPAGFVGNPSRTPRCSAADLNDSNPGYGCPLSTQIGRVAIHTSFGDLGVFPVFNMETDGKSPARFGFNAATVTVFMNARVPVDGQRLRIEIRNTSQALPLTGTTLTMWGVPASREHDYERGFIEQTGHCNPISSSPTPPCPANVPETAFLSNGTSCQEPQRSDLAVTSWQDPEDEKTATYITPALTGCESLRFDPELHVDVAQHAADSPSGVSVRLEQEQIDNPTGTVSAHLAGAKVVFPEGMAINPAAADGLATCTEAEFGLGEDSEAKCPQASKVGSVRIVSPLLDEPLEGGVYQATQDQNPFGSTLALYVAPEGPGMQLKLAGEVATDPETGQLTTTFDGNPQLPFNTFELKLKGGQRAPLVTPPSCGIFEATAELGPWSAVDPAQPSGGEIVTPSSSFTIDRGPSGAPCPAGDPSSPGDASDFADRGFDPQMKSGLVNPVAASSSPFVLKLTRPDGSQELDTLTVSPPEGVTSVLKSADQCSDQDIANNDCPESSKIGTTTVGVGAGNSPYYVQGGEVYLAGPYKGAPLSLDIQVPAIAGPFDLGIVNVRSAIEVDKRTAQLTISSDPLPQILEGIPLRIKDLRVNIDKPGFMLAPTNCSPMSVEATVNGINGAEAELSNRFQVGDCAHLDFGPNLNLQYKGKGSKRRNSHPRLAANLKIPQDESNFDSEAANDTTRQANLDKVRVVLPRGTFLDNDALSRVCTPTQWEASDCPEDSKIGNARAWSPILDEPLKGPVYLKVGPNELPDIAADLDGIVDIDLFGKIDQSKGRIRNTFQVVPDVPVERFRMSIRGGDGGLLVNSRDICRGKKALRRANVAMAAHNGARLKDKQSVVRCGKKAKRKRRR